MINETKTINVRLIAKCIKDLKGGKSDGSIGFSSDHIINGGNTLYVYLSFMFQSMLIHGFTPDVMLKSTIISIPKNAKGDLTNSENYRGIILCNSMCKLFDLLFISLNDNGLNTSNLQFAFKEGHGTNMCTSVVKEIIAHYKARGSPVYACFVDASKAFDKINLGKLFTILIKRDISAIFIRLLLDSYLRQSINANWCNIQSDSFASTNGVRQGAILSPLLFNIYMDELLLTLKNSDIGCHIGCYYVGSIGYADDLTLLCPTRHGLQKMLNICETFGSKYNVTYNPKKTVSIIFDKLLIIDAKCVTLCNVDIEWTTSVKYLGNILSFNGKDYDDICSKRGDFISSVNSITGNFTGLSCDILNVLFKSYCCCFYVCQTWCLYDKSFNVLFTAFNKGLRRIWGLHYQTHRKIIHVYALANIQSCEEIIISRFVKAYNNMVTVNV